MKTTLRKLLILTLSLALALSLATIAWGETTEYPIIISSTQVTSDNAADVLGDGTVSYDAAANTLTLNGATIVHTGSHEITVQGDITIHLIGDNTVTAGAGLMGINVSSLTGEEPMLTITGEEGASLTVSGGHHGINVAGDLQISDTTVTAAGDSEYGIAAIDVTITDSCLTANGEYSGINASAIAIDNSTVEVNGLSSRGLSIGNAVTITNSTVTANGASVGINASTTTIDNSTVTATGSSEGISTREAIVISGANTKVTASGETHGIVAIGDITITDGEVTATGGNDGIYAGGDITITDGEVTATGGNSGIFSERSIAISGANTKVTTTGGRCGIQSVNALTIDGSEVIATGTEYRGINCGGNIAIKNGTVTAEGVQGIVASETITIHSSKVEATGTTDTALVASAGVTISDSEVSATGGLNGISNYNGSITIDGSEVTATGTTQYGIIGDTVTITDSTVTTKGNGITGIESSTVTITASTVTATDNTYYGIIGDTLTITDSRLTATGNDRSGISGDNVTITNSTVTAEGAEHAIMTDLLNITNGNWYQWTGDDNEIVHSGIGTLDRPLTTEEAANNRYLKIEPLVCADHDYAVTLMNGEDVWHIHGANDGASLGFTVGMPVPAAPAGYPEGAVFFHWKDENDQRIYPTATVSGDMTLYATWAMPLEGTVTISGKAVVGKTLTATVNVTTPGVSDEDLTYQWLRGKGRDARPIMGAESATYTPTRDDVGKALTCWVGSPAVAPGSISAETDTVRSSGGGGGSYSSGGSGEEPLVTSPNTFDSGIAASMVVTILAATGSAWLSKKKD